VSSKTHKIKVMGTYRITYRMEVFINAESQEDAQWLFDNEFDVYDLTQTPSVQYVEQESIEVQE